jgi:hypothetical protein
MVAGSGLAQPSGYAIELQNNALYQGALYAVGDYHQNNNGETWVSVVAHQIYIDNSSETFPAPPAPLLAGSPSTVEPILRLEPLNGHFRG